MTDALEKLLNRIDELEAKVEVLMSRIPPLEKSATEAAVIAEKTKVKTINDHKTYE